MSAKAIREVDGKQIVQRDWTGSAKLNLQCVQVTATADWAQLVKENPWLQHQRLVAKPDQLIKRRGKLGLLAVDVDFPTAQQWIKARMNTSIKVEGAEGKLNTFIIEPFVEHQPCDEHYICIHSNAKADTILFYHEGGVDIGDVDTKASMLEIPVGSSTPMETLLCDSGLLINLAESRRDLVRAFIQDLYDVYVRCNFTYLEVNPLVVVDGHVHVLDMAAKLDQTAEFECSKRWGAISFPPPWGRDATPEEAHIRDMDAKSGASLKLTILNRKGRVWTMIAGGGASVVFSDTICELGAAGELANYGEYSGAPSEGQTFDYALTILKLMIETKHPEGKILIIGGGIANFTNVAATFKGIVRALKTYAGELREGKTRIYVRRGGPNYQEGLETMRSVGQELGLPIEVYGPEVHMTSIVSLGLGLIKADEMPKPDVTEDVFARRRTPPTEPSTPPQARSSAEMEAPDASADTLTDTSLFTKTTTSIVWGMQQRAVQGMLDFDYACGRVTKSVSAMVYPFSGNHMIRFYWGSEEVLIPVYKNMDEAVAKHADADVLVNFASLRSAYESSIHAIDTGKFRAIAIIAEGIPENKTRLINQRAEDKGVVVIGPATVGGIKAGCFRIGNTGGMLDNIIASKLYRPGSVAYVSRSGGMSNELNNILARNTNGVYEGVAIGGDRYPGSTFTDHVFRYQNDPKVKMLVVLGEIGGTEEYKIVNALESGKITKPLVAWCIGTCAGMFTSEVQFGHAGASANGESETSSAKNAALKAAGAIVPPNFDHLASVIKETYDALVKAGDIVVTPEPPMPQLPIDYAWAKQLGLIRKPTAFLSTITDERGDELLYAGMPISKVFEEQIGIGGVLSLLWFKRRLPTYACKFIELCLMVTADHGPAVSGAHNTIVTTRAGKDLVSSLAAGLLTIGPRFGGALDGAANMFTEAFDLGLTPHEFVGKCRKESKLILGIGHKVKSLNNPDKRVTIVKDFVKEHFPESPLLQYACEVEKVTTAKKPNLILNVDGAIAVSFVDLLRTCGAFTKEEAAEYISIGALNGLFVLGRSMGFIAHHLDQKRLKQGLYRHDVGDISYMLGH